MQRPEIAANRYHAVPQALAAVVVARVVPMVAVQNAVAIAAAAAILVESPVALRHATGVATAIAGPLLGATAVVQIGMQRATAGADNNDINDIMLSLWPSSHSLCRLTISSHGRTARPNSDSCRHTNSGWQQKSSHPGNSRSHSTYHVRLLSRTAR